MDKIINQKKLYLVTDSGRYSHYKIANDAYHAGCDIIQLRYKGYSSHEFFEIATKIRKMMVKEADIFIVNDRADIAKAVEADCLHIGDDDIPFEFAKLICGVSIKIGLSTHNLDEAVQAEEMGVDYIGLGPIFFTKTKLLKHNPIGLDEIRKVRKLVNIPIVAISGINKLNARSVLDAGADAVAVSSAICHADDIEKEVHLFFKEIDKV